MAPSIHRSTIPRYALSSTSTPIRLPRKALTLRSPQMAVCLLGGIFTEVDDLGGPSNGERWGAVKLHSDGTVDTSFTTSHKEGYKIEPGNFARQTDTSTLIGFNSLGYDTLHHAIPHNLGRLLSKGT